MSNQTFEDLGVNSPIEESEKNTLQGMRPVPRVTIHAFCESEGVAKPIERAGQDRRMAKSHLSVYMGGLEAAIQYYQSANTPNLIILESRMEPQELLHSLDALAELCDPTSKVIIIGHYNDVWLYRELVKAGVSEYIVAPISMADVVGMVSALFVDPSSDPVGQSIAFVGAKGGVGSSTIAHNTSWALSSLFSTEVIVADLDLPFGTANINFDQDPAQGIADAVFSPERIDEVYLDRLLGQCAEHLSLLAAPSTLDRTYDFDADSFASIVEVCQRSAPIVTLDVPHVWNAWTKTTLSRADDVVIVAEPELTNLRNAKNLLDTLARLRPNDKTPRLVLNKVGMMKRPEISVSEFCDPLGVEPAVILEFEPAIFGSATNNGRMISEMDARHPVAQGFEQLAHVLTGRAQAQPVKKAGLDGFMSKLKLKR